MADGMAGAPRAYIGSFTAAGGPGIVTAAVDPDSGALTVLGTADGLPDPSYLALAPDGKTLYAVSETERGAVAAYRASGEGLEPAGAPVPVGGGPTHLSVYAGHLLTADYGSGSVTAVPLRPDGTLGEVASSVLRHTGSGPSTPRQTAPHAHQVQADPSGRWAVSVDLGTDSVRVCRLAGGKLRLHREIAMRPGSGPRHLAFHPDGRRAYLLNELTPTLTACRWNATEGLLEPLAETAVLPAPPKGDAYPSGIAVTPDGRFVLAATRGTDVISVFAAGSGDHDHPDDMGATDGGVRPRLSGTVPCGGHWPRAITVHGRFLYVANERSGDVTWFRIDPVTGTPERRGALRVPAASCVVIG